MKKNMFRVLSYALSANLILFATSIRAEFAAYADLTVAGYEAERPALENFPVLVRISESGIPGFAYSLLQADGKDLAFTSIDGAATYPHEIDTWNPAGESLVWVLLPTMENGTTFRMHFGDESIAAAPDYTTSGQLWIDAGYVGVWHLGEETASPYSYDATANHLDATNNAVAAASVVGIVGNGRNPATTGKNGKDGMIVEGWAAWQAEHFTDAFTVTSWYRHSGGSLNYDHLFTTKESYASSSGGWAVLTAHANSAGWYTYGDGGTKNQFKTNIVIGASAEWQHIAVTYNGSNRSLYLDGTLAKSEKYQTKATVSTNALALGSAPYSTSNGNHWRGDLDEMRISIAPRSDDWVHAEYQAVKNAAFLSYNPVISDVASLVILGNPDNYGTADPAYGTMTAISAGDSFTASVTATNLMESGVERWICTGYTHNEILDSVTGERSVVQQGNTNAFAYNHVRQDELIWHFTNEWLVSVSAHGSGTVSVAEENWVLNGETISLTATPEEAYEFYHWAGDTDGIADVSSATISLTITKPRTLRAVFVPSGMVSGVQYVAADGDDANHGYVAELPKRTIQAAVDTLALGIGFGTVYVAPGVYEVSIGDSVTIGENIYANVAVTNAISIVGVGGNPEDVIVRNTTKHNLAQVTVFYLNHPDASVANVTAEDGHRNMPSSPHGAGFSIDAAGGTVSNCVIRGAECIGNYARGIGAWLNSDAAFLTHCVITNNTASGTGFQTPTGGYSGMFVQIEKGTVANCLIANNRDSSKDVAPVGQEKQAWGSGVTVLSGKLLNCTVATNEAPYTAGVYLYPNGYATNVVVAGCVNTCRYLDETQTPRWSDVGFKGSLENAAYCASDGGEALNATCVAGTAMQFFRDPDAGDFLPASNSPLVNSGFAYAGLAPSDLLGVPRDQGRPDIGCYEIPMGTILLIFR